MTSSITAVAVSIQIAIVAILHVVVVTITAVAIVAIVVIAVVATVVVVIVVFVARCVVVIVCIGIRDALYCCEVLHFDELVRSHQMASENVFCSPKFCQLQCCMVINNY